MIFSEPNKKNVFRIQGFPARLIKMPDFIRFRGSDSVVNSLFHSVPRRQAALAAEKKRDACGREEMSNAAWTSSIMKEKLGGNF